jgi:hypothetical protein
MILANGNGSTASCNNNIDNTNHTGSSNHNNNSNNSNNRNNISNSSSYGNSVNNNNNNSKFNYNENESESDCNMDDDSDESTTISMRKQNFSGAIINYDAGQAAKTGNSFFPSSAHHAGSVTHSEWGIEDVTDPS